MQPYVPVRSSLIFAIFAAAIAPASDLPNPFRRFDVNDDNRITRKRRSGNPAANSGVTLRPTLGPWPSGRFLL